MTTPKTSNDDPDVHKGAVEGDRPDEPQHGNPNAPALDDDGLPADPIASRDQIGANEDDTQG